MDLLNADSKQLANRIREKRSKLKKIGKQLKKHFVGIDTVIDKILKNLETWYCCPELLTRPVTICLFGPTGVGKTDLVRRLVKLLDFQDRFCEIEMVNKGSSNNWHSTISSVLSSNPKIQSGTSSVLLLDEIQNFRTVNEDGHDLPEYKYRDIWTLLSDGKLPFHVELDYMLQLLWDYNEKEKIKKNKKKNGKFVIPNKFNVTVDDDIFEDDDEDDSIDTDEIEEGMDGEEHYTGGKPIGSTLDLVDDEDDDEDSYYTLKHFKSVLRLPESMEEISKWSFEKKKAMIMKRLEDPKLYEEIDYTKTLIFISGNLDEAYEFANRTSEVDVDADIFHDLSLKINILDIKKALLSRFKPEQIARFGNMHVIYPTLSKKSYETIIQRKIDNVIKNVETRFGIEIEIDKSINDLIYQNGVFPTQGTRPVFSTISEIVECPLPIFMLNSIGKKNDKIIISYASKNICANIGSKILKVPYEGSLDKLKDANRKDLDRRISASVHEAGHAIVYASLFKVSPAQMSSLPTSSDVGGFIWTHHISGSEQQIEYKIAAMVAGSMAEKIVFGQSSWGGQDDLQEATKLAGNMVKRYGMKDISSYVVYPTKGDIYNTDLNAANPMIEAILKNAIAIANKVICGNLELFKKATDYLASNNKLTPECFKTMCAKHGLKIAVKKSEEIISGNYLQEYKEFKKK